MEDNNDSLNLQPETSVKKIHAAGKFNTSLGFIYTIEDTVVKIGDKVDIDGEIHTVERIIFPTRPIEKNIAAIAVSPPPNRYK